MMNFAGCSTFFGFPASLLSGTTGFFGEDFCTADLLLVETNFTFVGAVSLWEIWNRKMQVKTVFGRARSRGQLRDDDEVKISCSSRSTGAKIGIRKRFEVIKGLYPVSLSSSDTT